MVGGKAAREELPTYGRHSVQFGIWIAKDHIKVERLNEAIPHDNEFIHFLFVPISQDIELSANREKIRNISSAIYQAIERAESLSLQSDVGPMVQTVSQSTSSGRTQQTCELPETFYRRASGTYRGTVQIYPFKPGRSSTWTRTLEQSRRDPSDQCRRL